MASPDKANRHDLITGATGTGKTITLQTLAEGFSNLGMPVFLADIKGDLTGLSQAGPPQNHPRARFAQPDVQRFPHHLVGHVWRARPPATCMVSDLGPLLLCASSSSTTPGLACCARFRRRGCEKS